MKKVSFENKFYRDWINDKLLHKVIVQENQTDLFIQTDKIIKKDFIFKLVIKYRGQIQAYIDNHKNFLYSLMPISVASDASLIVKSMARNAKVCNVGPMASVAGAIANFIGSDLIRFGCEEILIENGGDLFIKTGIDRKLAIYSGSKKFSNRILLDIASSDSPLGVCTSSGTIGHSLSFGEADSVVICAKDAILADSAATSVCNMIKSKDDVYVVIKKAKMIPGIKGILIIIKDSLAAWGNITLSSG